MQEAFEVARHWIEELPFVQQRSVEIAELIFPKDLLGAEHELFQFTMRSDQQMRRRRVEANASFDSENRVAEMNPAPDAVLPANRVELHDEVDGISRSSIERARSAFLKSDG